MTVNNNTNDLNLSSCKIGDYIQFGKYIQRDEISSAKVDIEWLVLDKQDNKMLVISKYALDSKPYNTKDADVTWETCTLRNWLNTTFLNEAFTNDEQSRILTTNVTADKNPEYDTNPGNDTKDKIFLLSINEVNNYFSSIKKYCQPTSYAKAQGVFTHDIHSCDWWLRSPGGYQNMAARVDGYSYVSVFGRDVNDDDIGVRPALWINLESCLNETKEEQEVYKDSSEKSKTCHEVTKEQLPLDTSLSKDKSVGDVITFGSYEQGNDISNGKEDIEWLVLDKQDNKLLVISKYILDCKPYDANHVKVTWETCTLRNWLNTAFLNEAFTNEEQSKILTTNVTADKNPVHHVTNPGNDTQDKIFLLSINEVNNYFSSIKKYCQPTSYAIKHGVRTNITGSSYWLRSPGIDQDLAACCNRYGEVSTFGNYVDIDDLGVRPVLWINLESCLSEANEEQEVYEDSSKKFETCNEVAKEEQIPEMVEKIANSYKYALAKEIENKLNKKHEEFAALSNADYLNNKINVFINNINELKTKRSKLGIFAGKQKALIDAGIKQNEKIIVDLKITAEIEQKKLAQEIETIKKQLQNYTYVDNEEILSLDQADNCLNNNPNVKNNFIKKYHYLVVDSHKILFRYRACDIGDSIYFGSYEQDNDTSNGKEDIEWLVLDKQDNKLLVISKNALDSKPYNTKAADVTWETCTLRNWLNTTFLNEAFTNDEQSKILVTNVAADKNPKYDTNPGNDTRDKIFILSINEASKYFPSKSDRRCEPTGYAVARDVYRVGGYCDWWLRSPGENQNFATDVRRFGDLFNNGRSVSQDYVGIRPVLWINLES